LAVLDVETTGFSPRLGHRIVEVAVVRTDIDGTRTRKWTSLVNPLRGPGPSHVHGLTSADLDPAPVFSEIAGDLAAELDGAVLVAHNAPFDLDFLSHEFASLGSEPPTWASLCTLELATRFAPHLPSHKVAHCCQEEGITIGQAHAALGDAEATARLLTVYLARARQDGLRTLADLGCPGAPVAGWAPWKPNGRHRPRRTRAPRTPQLRSPTLSAPRSGRLAGSCSKPRLPDLKRHNRHCEGGRPAAAVPAVAEDLRASIARGYFQPGERLPSGRDLARR
jgi:ATP-dependent Lhr-like helicase